MGRGSTRLIVTIAGISILVGFFMPWLDYRGLEGASGFTLLRKAELSAGWLAALLAVPAGGLLLSAAGLAGVRFMRYLALLVGALIMGYGAYRAFQVFFSVTGPGIWLVAVGALIALVLGLLPARPHAKPEPRASAGKPAAPERRRVEPEPTRAKPTPARPKPEPHGKVAPRGKPVSTSPPTGTEETREITPAGD